MWPEFWTSWALPIFEPFIHWARHWGFGWNIPTWIEVGEDFADEIFVFAAADAFNVERIDHDGVGVWCTEFHISKLAGVDVRVVTGLGFVECEELGGINHAVMFIRLVRLKWIVEIFEDAVRLEEGPAVDELAECVIFGKEVAVAAIDAVGSFAENENVAAVFPSLFGGFMDLDFDGMDWSAFVLHEFGRESFEIFPINLDDAMFEAAFFGVPGSAWNFVGDFDARYDTLESVSNGALRDEFGEDGGINAAGKSEADFFLIFDGLSDEIFQMLMQVGASLDRLAVGRKRHHVQWILFGKSLSFVVDDAIHQV